jgi:hypothetical protein
MVTDIYQKIRAAESVMAFILIGFTLTFSGAAHRSK